MQHVKRLIAPVLLMLGAVVGLGLGYALASDPNNLGGTPVNIEEGDFWIGGPAGPFNAAGSGIYSKQRVYDDDNNYLRWTAPEYTSNVDAKWLDGIPASGTHFMTINSSGAWSFDAALTSAYTNFWQRGGSTLGPATADDNVNIQASQPASFVLNVDNSSSTAGSDAILVSAVNGFGVAASTANGIGVRGQTSSTDNDDYGVHAANDDPDHAGALIENADFPVLGGDPDAPPSGFIRLFAKSTGMFSIDSLGSVEGPFGAGGGGGGMTSWTIAGDSGSESVSDGQTATVAGSDGIDTAESGTRTAVVSLDLNELTAADDIDVKLDEISYGDNSGGDNNTILPVDLIYTLQARRMPVMMDEFLDPTTATVTAYTLHMGNLQANGASAGMIGVAGTAAHPGVAAVRTGTATTGRAAIAGGDTAIIFGGGEWRMTVICLIAVASDGTDTYTIRMGFNDSITGDGTDSAMFRYTHSVNGGEWEAVTQAAGVETGSATDTNVALDTANFVRFDIVVNAAGTSVEFFINGSSVATNSSNVPTAATGLMPVSIIKSAGSNSRQVQMDFAAAYNVLSTRR